MKEYYVVSDCHSYLKPLLESLSSAGYDKNNENHILIVAGDLFDRGDETIELYDFIKSIPQDRLILIRGNHEDLYLELLKKDEPDSWDFSNGTVRTFCAIAKIHEIDQYDMLFDNGEFSASNGFYHRLWKQVTRKVKQHEITKFIKSNIFKNYYEVDNYIITHSFIPLRVKDVSEAKWQRSFPTYRVDTNLLESVPSWKSRATKKQWEWARWGCPWRQFDAGLFSKETKRGKVLVVGHWHTSDFHEHYENDYVDENGHTICQCNNYSIYYGKNLIGIDGCLAYTEKQNVLVIKNGKCYDQFKKELEISKVLRESL